MKAALAAAGPYSSEFGAVHHEDARGFIFTVDPPNLAADVAAALNICSALQANPAKEP